MIIIPILIGLYIITMVGYYNLMYRTRELGPKKGSPLILRLTVVFLSVIWPVLVIWSLLVEALKIDD